MDDLRSLLDQVLAGETLAPNAWEQLSALSGERYATFRTLWDSLTAPQRLGLLDSLHTEAEATAHLDFTPIWLLALEDPSPKVRLAGIEYSADEDGDWLVDPLLRLCSSDPDVAVRAAAADALGRFAYLAEVGDLSERRGRQIEDLLLATIERTDEAAAVRAGALASVGYFSTPRVHEAIVRGHADAELRPSALRAMGHNCDPAWTETLLAETQSRNAVLREEAARAIGEIEDVRGVPRLVELLEDPSVSVRVAAIWALGEIVGPDAEEALMYCLEDSQEAIREAAEAALTQLAERADPLGI